MKYQFKHSDGTEISVSGPQSARATALIQTAPDMLAFLEGYHDRLERLGKNGTNHFNLIGVLIARARGETR